MTKFELSSMRTKGHIGVRSSTRMNKTITLIIGVIVLLSGLFANAQTATEGRVFFLGIGIENYNSTKVPGKPSAQKDVTFMATDLNKDVATMAEADNAFHFALLDGRDIEYKEVRSSTLFDTRAKRYSVDSAFSSIGRKTNMNDMFILYIDATTDEETGNIYLPGKVKGQIDTLTPNELAELITLIPCQKQIIIVDDAALSKLHGDITKTLCLHTETNKVQVVIVPTKNDTVNRSEYRGGKLACVLLQSKGCLLNVFKTKDENLADIESSLNSIAWKFDQGATPRYVKIYASIPAAEAPKPKPNPAPAPPEIIVKTNADSVPIKNYALIIGINDYKNNKSWRKLNNPINDERALYEVLTTEYDFIADTLENPSKQRILQYLARINTLALGTNSQVLIYYAGHGGERADLGGYLVPSDGEDPALDTLGESYIQYSELYSKIKRLQVKHKLVILDACHSGSFFDDPLVMETGGLGRGVDQPVNLKNDEATRRFVKESMKGRFFGVITSAARDQNADDGTRSSGHSPFMKDLATYLKSQYVKGDVFTYTTLSAELSKRADDKAARHQILLQDAYADFIFIPSSKH